MRVNEKKLIRNASNGDLESWQQIWELWTPRLQMFLYRDRAIGREDREELIQDIMLAVFQNLKQFNPHYCVSTWMYTIARRKMIDWKRKEYSEAVPQRVYRGTSLDENGKDSTEIVSGCPGPEELLLRRDLQATVRCFIDNQENLDRRILLLVCYEGLSGRAAAKVLGIPNSTVRDRLRRLKRELAEEVL